VAILHIQLPGEVETSPGQAVSVPPRQVLIERGPLIQVVVSLAQIIAAELTRQGTPMPQPVPGLALVDTGAFATCIDEQVANDLGLPVVDVVNVATASQGSVQANVYPIRIEILGASDVISVELLRALGAPLAAQGLLLLIGRDVLQHCTLFYNGVGEITLAV
jgi:predicted aspartyl protease